MQARDIWHLFRMYSRLQENKTRLNGLNSFNSHKWVNYFNGLLCPIIQKGNNDNIDSEKCSLVELMPAAELAS